MCDIMLAHNVPAYIATRICRVLKVTSKVATPGGESAVYDCLVIVGLHRLHRIDAAYCWRCRTLRGLCVLGTPASP